MSFPSRRHFSAWLLALFLGLVLGPSGKADPREIPFERPAHQIVEQSQITPELNSTPLPFLDWGTVQAGSIRYVRRGTNEVVPLNDPHNLERAEDIEAVPIAVPYGIRLRGQAGTKGGTFEEELFKPAYPWEENFTVHTLLFDPADRRYKLWYRTKAFYCYAESTDFKTWERPLREIVTYEGETKTNILGIVNQGELDSIPIRSLAEARPGQSGSFFVDPTAPPESRYKSVFLAHLNEETNAYAQRTGMPLSAMTGPGSTVLWGAVSADGIGWRILPKPIMLHDADTQTVASFDAVRNKYVLYTRLYELNRRTIAYAETDDFENWPLPRNCMTPGASEGPSSDYYANAFAVYPDRTDLRVLFPLVYDRAIDRSEIRLASSRDGHVFHFLPGEAAVSTGPGVPGESGFLAAFPSLVRTPDDRLVLFCDVHHAPHKFPRHRFGGSRHFAATWKRDRLSAIEALEVGEFTTVPLELRGSQIVLNMMSERTGGILLQLHDENFRPIAGRKFAECDLLFGDHETAIVSWNGDADVAPFAGRDIYLSFRLRSAKLYSISATSPARPDASAAQQ